MENFAFLVVLGRGLGEFWGNFLLFHAISCYITLYYIIFPVYYAILRYFTKCFLNLCFHDYLPKVFGGRALGEFPGILGGEGNRKAIQGIKKYNRSICFSILLKRKHKASLTFANLH